MSDLDKAREWAKSVSVGPATDRAYAAADVINSLPDLWVDAEKLKVIIEDMCDSLEVEATTDFSKGFDNSTMTWLNPLKDLIAPKLPTLADMSEEERGACQWMQAKIPDSDQIHVIANVWPAGSLLWRADGHSCHRNNALITPLLDVPKLQWPGNEVVEPPALPEGMRLADHETLGRIVVSQRTDRDGDYAFFESIPGGIAGASWGYVHKSELTFLGGEA